MLYDSQIVPQTIVRPNSFVGLMALYESNYLRLLQLIPEIERLDGCFRSRVAGECDLFVEILECCRYTTTLSLTYRFIGSEGGIADPDMTVRVYQDCGLAEAMSIGAKRRPEKRLHKLAAMYTNELDVRWRRNIILNKWLEFLSDQGHLILER